jgi:hypothetical protein
VIPIQTHRFHGAKEKSKRENMGKTHLDLSSGGALHAACCGVAKLPYTNNEGKLKLKNQNQNPNTNKEKPKTLSQQ